MSWASRTRATGGIARSRTLGSRTGPGLVLEAITETCRCQLQVSFKLRQANILRLSCQPNRTPFRTLLPVDRLPRPIPHLQRHIPPRLHLTPPLPNTTDVRQQTHPGRVGLHRDNPMQIRRPHLHLQSRQAAMLGGHPCPRQAAMPSSHPHCIPLLLMPTKRLNTRL